MNRPKITNISSIDYKEIKRVILKTLGYKIIKERQPGLHFKFINKTGCYTYLNIDMLIELSLYCKGFKTDILKKINPYHRHVHGRQKKIIHTNGKGKKI